MNKNRCQWCQGNLLMQQYHDQEWGKPNHDDTKHFEFLVLESAQAGLSWQIILNKRQEYKKEYLDFDVNKISSFTEKDIARLMHSGIVKNHRKIEASIKNAQSFIRIQKEFGTFDYYIWQFTDGKQIILAENLPMPVTSSLSDLITADLKKRGFSFLGSTIMYSFLQAIGIVNDHEKNCDFR